MSSDLTRKEQAVFAEDRQEMRLPIYKNQDGSKIVVNVGSDVPKTVTKVLGRRKTKKTKKRSKKRSLLKSRKVR